MAGTASGKEISRKIPGSGLQNPCGHGESVRTGGYDRSAWASPMHSESATVADGRPAFPWPTRSVRKSRRPFSAKNTATPGSVPSRRPGSEAEGQESWAGFPKEAEGPDGGVAAPPPVSLRLAAGAARKRTAGRPTAPAGAPGRPPARRPCGAGRCTSVPAATQRKPQQLPHRCAHAWARKGKNLPEAHCHTQNQNLQPAHCPVPPHTSPVLF